MPTTATLLTVLFDILVHPDFDFRAANARTHGSHNTSNNCRPFPSQSTPSLNKCGKQERALDI